MTVTLGSAPATIALLVVGAALLFISAVNEWYTKRSPIIPPRLFKVRHDSQQSLLLKTHMLGFPQTRTTGIVLITTFLHAFCFFAGMTLL